MQVLSVCGIDKLNFIGLAAPQMWWPYNSQEAKAFRGACNACFHYKAKQNGGQWRRTAASVMLQAHMSPWEPACVPSFSLSPLPHVWQRLPASPWGSASPPCSLPFTQSHAWRKNRNILLLLYIHYYYCQKCMQTWTETDAEINTIIRAGLLSLELYHHISII